MNKFWWLRNPNAQKRTKRSPKTLQSFPILDPSGSPKTSLVPPSSRNLLTASVPGCSLALRCRASWTWTSAPLSPASVLRSWGWADIAAGKMVEEGTYWGVPPQKKKFIWVSEVVWWGRQDSESLRFCFDIPWMFREDDVDVDLQKWSFWGCNMGEMHGLLGQNCVVLGTFQFCTHGEAELPSFGVAWPIDWCPKNLLHFLRLVHACLWTICKISSWLKMHLAKYLAD